MTILPLAFVHIIGQRLNFMMYRNMMAVHDASRPVATDQPGNDNDSFCFIEVNRTLSLWVDPHAIRKCRRRLLRGIRKRSEPTL